MKKNGYLGRQAEQIYKALDDDIEKGRYQPGSQLPTEKELCSRFRCSNLTLRKALKKLGEENKIESRRGAGSFVREDALNFNPLKNDSNVIALMYLGDIDTLTEFQDAALQNGFVLTVYSQNRQHWSPEKEREFFQSLLEQRPRALLAHCSPLQPYNDDLLFQLERNGTHVIHIDAYKTELPDTSFVLPDYHRVGYSAAVTFMLRGYEHFYFVGMDGDGPYARLQEQGFYHALAEQRGSTNQRMGFSEAGKGCNYLTMPKFGIDSEEEIAEMLRIIRHETSKPAGLLTATTDRALHLNRLCRDEGYRVPDDFGILTPTNFSTPQVDRNSIDYFDFDRVGAIKKAIASIAQPGFKGIHQMQIPKLVFNGKTLKRNCQ